MKSPALEARFTLTRGSASASFRLQADLSLPSGVLVLFGPSGAGKTLALEGIAGLLRPAAGFVRVAGERCFDAKDRVWVPPHRRRVGLVPQRSSLFPFADVLDNVAFGVPRRARDPAALEALMDELGIGGRARSMPDELSGGERQRVALARALAVSPRLLLLDEPFASIDRPGRAALGAILRDVLARRGTPAVLVTHDPAEARELGDLVVPVEAGQMGEATPAADFFAKRA